MKKHVYQMKGFTEIYNNSEKEKMEDFLLEIEKKIENIFLNKELTTLNALTLHRLIYVIEKTNISNIELEKNVYYLAYYFLKEYIDIKKLIQLSKMNENELKKESEKSVELIKKYYKIIENKELDIDKIFIDMKNFVEWKKNEKN